MRDTVVVIAGASSGIGAAIADRLGRHGAPLVLAARRQDLLDVVARRCGPHTLALAADLTRRTEVRRVLQDGIAAYGRIDVWVNCVGRGITRLPSELTDEDLDLMMLINVKSALYAMQEVLPHFRARGRGHVINISSMLGRVPLVPYRAAYSAAKAYLNTLTESFRAEVQESQPGIQFSLVSPGVVATDFGKNAVHGGPDSRVLSRPQPAEEVAAVVLDVIVSRCPDMYTRKGSRERVARYVGALGSDP